MDVPGSIWQFETVKELGCHLNVVTGAIRQSDFGTAYQKPTRLLGRLPGLSGHMFEGWPIFDDDGHYAGPLPKFTGTSTRLIGRQGKAFRTTDTAAWPERLCHLLAQLAVAAACNSAHADALTKGVGCGDCGVGTSSIAVEPFGAPARLPQSDEELTQITGPCTAQEAEVHGFRHPNVEPRGAPRRRKITQAEFSSLARGGKLQDHEVYVGRGGRGCPPQNGTTHSGSDPLAPGARPSPGSAATSRTGT